MPSRVRNLVRDDLLLKKGGQNEKKQPTLFYSSVFVQKTEACSENTGPRFFFEKPEPLDTNFSLEPFVP